MVHQHSVRSLGPFIEVSCAGEKPSLLARRLLGHALEDGHSQATQGGKCTEAEGGTLVLAEVGQASPAVVLGVLRTLGLMEPLVSGAVSPDGNARLILTSTCPLNQERIRLLFRDSVHVGITPVRLRLPPLRERSVDVPLLAHYFLEHFSAEHRRKVRSIAPDAMRALVRYGWPGNVAELKSVVEQRVLLNPHGKVRRQDLPKAIRGCQEPCGGGSQRRLMPLKAALREPERRYILRALEQTGWNKQQAAARLEISRSTLYKKLEEHGIEFDRHSRDQNGLSSEECVSILDIALSE
jgi:DNA-binding NtrC family response regulator